jgi:hypothetical protein
MRFRFAALFSLILAAGFVLLPQVRALDAAKPQHLGSIERAKSDGSPNCWTPLWPT